MARLLDGQRAFHFHGGGEFYQDSITLKIALWFFKAIPHPWGVCSQPRLCKCPDSVLLTKGQDPQALGSMEEREVVIVNIN